MITLHRKQSWLVPIGAVGLALTALGGLFNARQFFVSWLTAEVFWLGLSLGSLAWAMIHYLTGGRWGFMSRRIFESAMAVLPFLLVGFIPLFFGLRFLYPWATAAAAAADPIIRHRSSYMNGWGFVLRALMVFGAWLFLSWRLSALSRAQQETTDPEPTRKLRTLSGPGLVIYPMTATFAFVDWIMSTEADWFSTMFPILICVGQMLCALCAAILLLAFLRDREPFREMSTPEPFHHLGNLLLALTMMWAYLAFSQLLIIWAGDLPHEISWYLHRTSGSWKYVVIFLFLVHFAIPFALLLSRKNKQRVRNLAIIAGTVFVAHAVDVWWMIAPSYHPMGLFLHWMDLTAFIGVGALWLGFFASDMARRPALPVNDPRFAVAPVAL